MRKEVAIQRTVDAGIEIMAKFDDEALERFPMEVSHVYPGSSTWILILMEWWRKRTYFLARRNLEDELERLEILKDKLREVQEVLGTQLVDEMKDLMWPGTTHHILSLDMTNAPGQRRIERRTETTTMQWQLGGRKDNEDRRLSRNHPLVGLWLI